MELIIAQSGQKAKLPPQILPELIPPVEISLPNGIQIIAFRRRGSRSIAPLQAF